MKPHSTPQACLKLVKQFFDDLEKRGVIFKRDSAEWLSPAFCQPKKNSGTRLLIDMRELNKVTEREHWPLAKIDNLLDRIGSFE